MKTHFLMTAKFLNLYTKLFDDGTIFLMMTHFLVVVKVLMIERLIKHFLEIANYQKIVRFV